MKIPGKEEVEGFGNTLITGFLEGAAVGVPVALGLRMLLDRRTAFRSAGTFPRTLFLIAPPVFCGATWMEIRSRQFEEARREALRLRGMGTMEGAAGIAPEVSKTGPGALDTGITSWIADNKYKCIIGGWAAVLGGSFYAVNKDPYLTRSQKIVQARVWAQGATVIMLVASVLLSVGTSERNKKAEREEMKNSWLLHMKKD